jgi:hypothetical protein
MKPANAAPAPLPRGAGETAAGQLPNGLPLYFSGEGALARGGLERRSAWRRRRRPTRPRAALFSDAMVCFQWLA